MIRIENNAKFQAAAARCKAIHPRVRRVNANTVAVSGSKGAQYTVTFAEPKPGLKLAACNCKAGQNEMVCYHIAAALCAPAHVAVIVPVVPDAIRSRASERENAILVRPQPKKREMYYGIDI